LTGVFYLAGLLWLLERYGGCMAGSLPDWICNTGAAPSYAVAAALIALSAMVLRELHVLGASAVAQPRGHGAGRRVLGGYRTLPVPHRRHVHHTLRAAIYVLGGVIGFTVFWGYRARVLEGGAWLVQAAFIVAAEMLIAQLSGAHDQDDGDDRPTNDKPSLDWNSAIAEEAGHLGLPRVDGMACGLALSGGGIRSATFCLGVLQALASQRLLKRFHYLSTVSGGSYIGSWLTAWVHRKGLEAVEKELGRERHEPPEVNWLRQYSNYLAPRPGLLSADSLTLVATWLRNVALNLVVLVSFLAFLFIAARLALGPALETMNSHAVESGYASAWFGLFLVPLAISFHLSYGRLQTAPGRPYWIATTAGVISTVLAPGALSALLASFSFFSGHTQIDQNLDGRLIIAAAPLLMAGAVWWYIAWLRPVGGRRTTFINTVAEGAVFAVAYATALLAAYLLIEGWKNAVFASNRFAADGVAEAAQLLTFGPPLVLLSFSLCGTVVVGLVGRVYMERSREWWGRMIAWLFVVAMAWWCFFALVFYAKPLVDWVLVAGGTWAKSLGAAGWAGSLLATLKAPQPAGRRTLLQRLGAKALNLAATIVIGGFLIAVAYGTASILYAVAAAGAQGHPAERLELKTMQMGFEPDGSTLGSTATYEVRPSVSFNTYRQAAMRNEEVVQAANLCGSGEDRTACDDGASMPAVPTAAVAMLLVFLLFGARVDVNKFSLHNMYKNRLIRCYLGASRRGDADAQMRHPQPFTGFDDEDDPELYKVHVNRAPVRLLHLVNTALNLTHGANLAWQERKAASFTLSPYHCGYSLPSAVGDTAEVRGGYRDTRWYASEHDEQRHFTLGMAMATSGAALSPNSGRATTKPLAFLMTLFNVRLGRWSPNPTRRKWMDASPRVGFFCLLQELFGYANEARNFVYLSDGGHFENTGVYELVRRGCRTIVSVDAGADEARAYEDLANLVRKCRVDFGAEIRLPLKKLGTTPEASESTRGFSVGTIAYRDGSVGTLIVLKPTLVGGLASALVDVFGYGRQEPNFPQQSTVDQFFDESQFESYRALGFCIASEAIADITSRL
jgi:hypothetical protein